MGNVATSLSRKSIFDNPRERVADSLLKEVSEKYGNRLHAKVRLADLMGTGAPGELDEEQLRYLQRAHLDFVLVDVNGLPILAVELDGRIHSTDPNARWRDQTKNELCDKAGIPLVRVNNDFTRREGKYILLVYICDVFYRGLHFDAAQADGALPEDEVFDHGLFIEKHDDGGIYFGTLDARARVELLRLWESKKILHYCPDVWTAKNLETGDICADVYLNVAKDRVLIGSASVRSFGFYGFDAHTLASEVAVLDLRDKTRAWLDQQPVALAQREFNDWFRRFASQEHVMRHSWTSCSEGGDVIPYPPHVIRGIPNGKVVFD